MKKIKFLILILTLAVVAVSCESYDDYDTPRETIAGFISASKNINRIPEGGTKTETLDIFVSSASSEERTFTIEVVPVPNPEENIPTDPENYTFDSTVTIPANERSGSISVTGIDVSISDVRTFFQLAVKAENDVVSGGKVLIGLKN